MTSDALFSTLADLAAEFDQLSERCHDRVGQADCALQAAAIWENAAKRVRRKLVEVQGG